MDKDNEWIDIKTLKTYSHQNNGMDDYLFLTNRLNNLLTGKDIVRIKVFLMIYCLEGELRLELNDRPYH